MGQWSHLAFEKLIKDDSIEIMFIVPRKDTKDLTLKRFSEKYNIGYIFPANINSIEFIETVIPMTVICLYQ
jgi:methionyl-tRNA formyltransferase